MQIISEDEIHNSFRKQNIIEIIRNVVIIDCNGRKSQNLLYFKFDLGNHKNDMARREKVRTKSVLRGEF